MYSRLRCPAGEFPVAPPRPANVHRNKRSVALDLKAEVADRGLVTRVQHPVAGWVPNITPPSRLSDTPVVDPVCAPMLGEHTEDVLPGVLGYDDQPMAALRSVGALGAEQPV